MVKVSCPLDNSISWMKMIGTVYNIKSQMYSKIYNYYLIEI